MKLSLTHNLGRGIAFTTKLQSEFPAALKKAVNDTIRAVDAAHDREVRSIFDRPTPYTLRSRIVFFASLKNPQAPAEASMRWRDGSSLRQGNTAGGTPAVKYIAPHVSGGDRGTKRFERKLQAVGLLPEGWRTVPAAGARLDAFGNVSIGQLRQVLSQLGLASTLAGSSQNLPPRSGDKRGQRKRASAFKRAGGQFFGVAGGGTRSEFTVVGGEAVKVQRQLPSGRGKLKPGVWQRQPDGSVLPVLLFVRNTRYRNRYAFDALSRRVADATFPGALRQRLQQAQAAAAL